MRPILALAAAILAVGGGWSSVQTQAKPFHNLDVVNGQCMSYSHIAEGPIGTDLTKRQSRFHCDAAIIAFLGDYPEHVMVQFTEKEAHHMPVLGFAGRLTRDGMTMTVDHVYLVPRQATTVSHGLCKFFFRDRHMHEIFCEMYFDETGRRTSAVVVFEVSPGQ